MAKPTTIDGYSERVTHDCERVLVTLLRNLGPWKNSVFLVGGLTPRYLVPGRPPEVPQHAGTLDVDIVVDILILEDTDAYKTLEENLRKIGFDNATNKSGQKQSWRWRMRMDDGSMVILELLADRSDHVGGKVKPLPTEGNISALNVPHSAMVFDLHDSTDVTAELLGSEGVTTETIRYANIVSFVCLKALAFEDRAERKDAHDLVYCIENAPGGIEAAAASFRGQIGGKHQEVVKHCVELLRKHFASDEKTEGYKKDGPVMVANFELEESGTRENRILRQRIVADAMELFFNSLGSTVADAAAQTPVSEAPSPDGGR
jgi:hypothetical protein